MYRVSCGWHYKIITGAAATTATLARVMYCLRRVVHARRAVLQPMSHPEVGATQYLLASVLQVAMRHASKGSAVWKVFDVLVFSVNRSTRYILKIFCKNTFTFCEIITGIAQGVHRHAG